MENTLPANSENDAEQPTTQSDKKKRKMDTSKSAPSPLLENNTEIRTDPDLQKTFQSNSEIELVDQPKIQRSTVESNSLGGDDIVEKFKRKIPKSKSKRSLVQQNSSTPIDWYVQKLSSSNFETVTEANSHLDLDDVHINDKRKIDMDKNEPSAVVGKHANRIDSDLENGLPSNSHSLLEPHNTIIDKKKEMSAETFEDE